MIGIARAMAAVPDLPEKWRLGESLDIELPAINWRKKVLANIATSAITKIQLIRLGRGQGPKAHISPLLALIRHQIRTKLRTKRYRNWISHRLPASGGQ